MGFDFVEVGTEARPCVEHEGEQFVLTFEVAAESDRGARFSPPLDEDELAFYDAVAERLHEVYDDRFLSGLIQDVVRAVKRNLRVDWTEPHRMDVKAAIRAAVKRVLRTRGVRAEDFDYVVDKLMEQAEVLYRDWPLAA